MVSPATWVRYVATKLHYSLSTSWKSYEMGQISVKELGDSIRRNVLHGKLTYMHWNKGVEMAPTVSPQGGTLLVRKLPFVDPMRVFVGDMVVLKDPENPDNYLVRRLSAIEGNEMVSSDEKDTPFVLDENECWVVSENESLKPKEARDSRSFGPVPMSNIVGRVIYSLRTAVDHGPVHNSYYGMQRDSSILAVELDVDEMAKNHRL